jgi:hypothetical protein
MDARAAQLLLTWESNTLGYPAASADRESAATTRGARLSPSHRKPTGGCGIRRLRRRTG